MCTRRAAKLYSKGTEGRTEGSWAENGQRRKKRRDANGTKEVQDARLQSHADLFVGPKWNTEKHRRGGAWHLLLHVSEMVFVSSHLFRHKFVF